MRAVILDELHVLDGSVRGDQLRAVLGRLRQVRAYRRRSGDAPGRLRSSMWRCRRRWRTGPATAARYFPAAQVVSVPADARRQSRRWRWPRTPPAHCSTTWPPSTPAAGARRWSSATPAPRWRPTPPPSRGARSPFGHAVFVHYSNLERARRQEIEQQFAQADAALCFASSTLELGIDIGSIDVAHPDRRAGQRGGVRAAHRPRRPPPADDPCGVLLPHAAGGGAALAR